MKNTIKFSVIITLMAIMGFSISACGGNEEETRYAFYSMGISTSYFENSVFSQNLESLNGEKYTWVYLKDEYNHINQIRGMYETAINKYESQPDLSDASIRFIIQSHIDNGNIPDGLFEREGISRLDEVIRYISNFKNIILAINRPASFGHPFTEVQIIVFSIL